MLLSLRSKIISECGHAILDAMIQDEDLLAGIGRVNSQFFPPERARCAIMAYDYTVVPDNLTHIRYLPGGFFSRHVDHCRGTSNIIEEFTLIVDAGSACSGGHTVIHTATATGGTTPTTFDSTTTLGGGLLFRTVAWARTLPAPALLRL